MGAQLRTTAWKTRRAPDWLSFFCALSCVLLVGCGEGTSPKAAPVAFTVDPNNGPQAGGTTVTITGTNLLNVNTALVGGLPLTQVAVMSATEVRGRTPAAVSSGARDVVVSSSLDGTGTCTGCFTYNPVIAVNGLSPNNGPLQGATLITISGANFPATIDSIQIGSERLADFTRVSATLITGSTPQSNASGSRNVIVYAASAGSGSCVACFTYNPTVTISTVNPNNGPLAGGKLVSILGAHFPVTIDSVLVGGARLGSVARLSTTELTGIIPAGSAPGTAEVGVFTSSAGRASCVGCFSYNPIVTVSGVSPTTGPRAGGTVVTVSGTNFLNAVSVTIGGTPLTDVNVLSSTQLNARTPAGTSVEAKDVVVTSSSHGSGSCISCFQYNPLPAVLSVTPNNGPLSGGTSVTITGTDFLNVTSVLIDGSPLANLTVVSGTQITGQTPASTTSQAMDVVVTSSSHGSGSCTRCFTYNPAVTVSSANPNNGPLAGGALITITGTNFLNVTAVTIGGSALTNLSVGSSTQLSGRTPATVSSGARDIGITSASHGNGTCAGCYTYNPAVTVTGVTPNNGPLTAPTSVTITGANFPATVDSVRLATGWIESLTRVSDTQLRGFTPTGVTAGTKDLVVYTTSAGTGGCAGCFTYNPAVLVSGVSPNRGPQAGGTPITITGANFLDVTRVKIGEFDLPVLYNGSGTPLNGVGFTVVSSTEITGLTPSSVNIGAKDVVVISDSHGEGSCAGCFTYPLVTWTSVVAGMLHSCGLGSHGDAYCWGWPGHGALGNGSFSESAHVMPAAVLGGLSFTALAARGGSHSCALTSNKKAYCWGFNAYGQLGDGSITNRSTPTPVAGDLEFEKLSVGSYHTCALTSAGKAYCWGMSGPQLGDESSTNRTTPSPVAGELTFSSLTLGSSHSCGLTSAGAAYCWGYNAEGALGDGSTTDRATPVAVAGGHAFTSLAAGGGHTCGVVSGGGAYCWGENGYGQVGDSTTDTRTEPTVLHGDLLFSRLVAGDRHTCGVAVGGGAFCWGANSEAQLGDGTRTVRISPNAVPGGLLFANLAAGAEHTCGVTLDGVAYCWGTNDQGRLGATSYVGPNALGRVANP